MCQLAWDTQGPIWSGKMRKDHSVMENRSEREGSKMNPCSITHFPALAALQDQPNVVLSMDVSSKVSRNKILLQLCQTTFKKKKMLGKLSDNTLEDARFQESRKHRAEVSASTSFPLLCFQHRPDTEIQPRDLRVNQYALYYVPQILIFVFKYYWQHCFYYFNHLRSHVGLYHKAIFHFCCQQGNLVSCHSELVPHYLPSLPVM